MKVRIHPNRHLVNANEEACISVKPMPKGRVHNAGTVVLRDVTFPIHKSGVEKAQREGVRNVHAWAEGELDSSEPGQVPLSPSRIEKLGLRKVTYYFQEGYFRDYNTGAVVTESKVLYAVGRDFYYLPKRTK